MTARVVWARPAEDDLLAIWTYLAREASARVADQQLTTIDKVCRALAQHPRKGRERNEIRSGLRSIASRPYIIFYRLQGTNVQIVRVLHGRRDMGRIFDPVEG